MWPRQKNEGEKIHVAWQRIDRRLHIYFMPSLPSGPRLVFDYFFLLLRIRTQQPGCVQTTTVKSSS